VSGRQEAIAIEADSKAAWPLEGPFPRPPPWPDQALANFIVVGQGPVGQAAVPEDKISQRLLKQFQACKRLTFKNDPPAGRHR